MDYEALKEQWSEIEDRDGIRLSWNTFPSSRMVSVTNQGLIAAILTLIVGGIASCCSYWCSVHAAEGEARHTFTSVRAGYLQEPL
jgi:hypothetical protein